MLNALHAPTCAVAGRARQVAGTCAAPRPCSRATPFAAAFSCQPLDRRARHLSLQPVHAVAEAEPVTAEAVEAEPVEQPVDQMGKYADRDKLRLGGAEIGGHQLLVEEGRWYTCNRLEAEPGSKLLLGRVLALKEAGQFHVGRPYLEDVRVEADVMAEVKAPKVVIFKMRAKKHYRRKTGHRQPLTKFLITKIARA